MEVVETLLNAIYGNNRKPSPRRDTTAAAAVFAGKPRREILRNFGRKHLLFLVSCPGRTNIPHEITENEGPTGARDALWREWRPRIIMRTQTPISWRVVAAHRCAQKNLCVKNCGGQHHCWDPRRPLHLLLDEKCPHISCLSNALLLCIVIFRGIRQRTIFRHPSSHGASTSFQNPTNNIFNTQKNFAITKMKDAEKATSAIPLRNRSRFPEEQEPTCLSLDDRPSANVPIYNSIDPPQSPRNRKNPANPK